MESPITDLIGFPRTPCFRLGFQSSSQRATFGKFLEQRQLVHFLAIFLMSHLMEQPTQDLLFERLKLLVFQPLTGQLFDTHEVGMFLYATEPPLILES